MLDDLKFVSNKDPHDELGVIERAWRDKGEPFEQTAIEWRADSPTSTNLAKQIAEYLAGKSVVVYGAYAETAHVWYENIALRAQARVFDVTVQEDMQTEISAWKSQPVDKLYGVLLLKSEHDREAVKESYKTMERQLSGRWPHPMSITAPKLTIDETKQWMQFLAEMSAAYLAVLHGVSPQRV